MADLQTQRDEVDAAITKLLVTGGGIASHTITTPDGGTQSVTYVDLDRLRAWRDQLDKELGRARSRAKGGRINLGTRGGA